MRLRELLRIVGGLAAVVLLAGPGSLGAQDGKGMMAPAAEAAPLAPVGTAFTYQGFLALNGAPTNGPYDFRFFLYDAAVGGAQVGPAPILENVPTTGGVFTVPIDFGVGAFGTGRWLEVRVRPPAEVGAFTILSPRQALTGAPIAQSLPNVFTDEASNFVGVGRDFRISGNEVFGLRYTGAANDYGGMYMETSNAEGWPFYGYATDGSFRAWHYYNGADGDWRLYNAGIRLTVPNEGGLRIGPSADYSLVIENTTGSDGIRVLDTGDDAIQIGSSPDYSNYGVYIPSPGVATYGLWSNTAQAAGEWALFTVDNIEAGNVFAAGFTQIARVAAGSALQSGDVVAAVGFGPGVPGAQDFVPVVVVADALGADGVVGVVHSRMELAPAPGKDELSLHSVAGPAVAGDFVAITVRGVAWARIDEAAEAVAGQRMTLAETAGRVRPLKSTEVDGIRVSEGSAIVGVALAAPNDDGVVPVYVSVR